MFGILTEIFYFLKIDKILKLNNRLKSNADLVIIANKNKCLSDAWLR